MVFLLYKGQTSLNKTIGIGLLSELPAVVLIDIISIQRVITGSVALLTATWYIPLPFAFLTLLVILKVKRPPVRDKITKIDDTDIWFENTDE